jgi:hypothetical protein
VSPSALLEIEEKTHEVIDLDVAKALVSAIFALDVSDWKDDSFAALEALIDKLISLLSAAPTAQHRPLIAKLLDARAGVEQGMAPDPAKRPTSGELRAFVSAHLP